MCQPQLAGASGKLSLASSGLGVRLHLGHFCRGNGSQVVEEGRGEAGSSRLPASARSWQEGPAQSFSWASKELKLGLGRCSPPGRGVRFVVTGTRRTRAGQGL